MTDTTPPRPLRDVLAAALQDARPVLFERLDDDLDAHLQLVALAQEAHGESGAILRAAVTSARGAGGTWEQIGAVLGMSRQAAQQRFGRDEPPAPPAAWDERLGADRPTSLVLRPLTAFNEMRVLERAGRHGWHSVGHGALFHVVERTDRQWVHLRVAGLQPELGPDWTKIGSNWGWWSYWKRETDLPALPGGDTSGDLLAGSML